MGPESEPEAERELASGRMALSAEALLFGMTQDRMVSLAELAICIGEEEEVWKMCGSCVGGVCVCLCVHVCVRAWQEGREA